MPPHKLALRLCDESQITVKCALLPVSRGFTARRTGSGLRFLVQQLDECVVALFKFGRFDRLHGEPEEGESRFRLPFLDIQAQGRPKQQRELHRRRGVSNAPAPTIAVSSSEQSVIVRWSMVWWSIRSVSLPLHVVSLDALGIWKGILGWRGHLRGRPVVSLLILGLWKEFGERRNA